MSEEFAGADAARQLEQLTRKRAALEQLLLLAHQLSRMQGGMGMLQQMLKPSQAPGRRISAIEELAAELHDIATAALQQQLGELDRLIARELSSVVVLSRLTRAEFIQRYCEAKGAADAAALLERQLEDFRRYSQRNVAIRYVLHGRGMQLKAAELPISQEAVAQRVEALRAEEQQCRQQMTQQAHDLLDDIAVVLADPRCTAEQQAQHRATQRGVERTLRLLASGRSLEELPLALDNAPAEDDAAPAPAAPAARPRPAVPAPEQKGDVAPPQRLGFWKKFMLWLDTPWQTKWKDIDRRK